MLKLYNLIPNEVIKKYKINNIFIKGITCDSRKIKKGYIFAAFHGVQDTGTNYINEAIYKGAVAILIHKKDYKKISNINNIEIIPLALPRKLYSVICNKFSKYNFKNIVGVTGTNGKTSVAWFVNSLTKLSGVKSASIGTLGIHHKSITRNNNLTTPESELIVSHLNQLYSKKVENIIIEASSHGLDQYRLDGVSFNIVAITSFTRDHLDYHKSFNNYKKAKLRLFSEVVNKKGTAIINENIPHYKDFIKTSKSNNLKVITIGKSSFSNWKYSKINTYKNNQTIELIYKNKKTIIFSKLIGDFQINNLITAIAIMVEMGFKREKIEKFIPKLIAPPGRLQFIKSKNGSDIYVDYAHTPDALENVLLSLRPYVINKLHLVFGCGGNRDIGKREKMGSIASNYADNIIITDDNPRYEDAKLIRYQIIKSCPNSIEIADRLKAIAMAINNLKKGDVLLVAGKGHESTQEIKGKFFDFNDAKIIKKLLARS